MRKLMHRSKGFTLIELMIVILIIAILVGIAIPVYLAARSNAQRRTCQANLRTIEGAVNTYIADQDTVVYPTGISDMVGSVLKSNPLCPASAGAAYGWSVGIPPAVSCPVNPGGNHTI